MILYLYFVNPFQCVHAFVQQKSSIIHKHINKFDELFSCLGFIDNCNLVTRGFPHGFHYNGNVISNGKFVVKFRGGTCLFHFCKEKKIIKKLLFLIIFTSNVCPFLGENVHSSVRYFYIIHFFCENVVSSYFLD